MKAPKISFDSAKLQQMLMLHVEKIVLCLVLVAVAWFIYQGVSLPSLEESKSPNKLSAEAARMTTQIGDPSHWALLLPDRKTIVEHDVPGLVKQGQLANAAPPYGLPQPWLPPNFPKAIARPDPRLFAPLNVKVVILHGPMAMLPTRNDVDPLLAAAQAAVPGVEGAQVRPNPQQPIRPPGAEGKRPAPPPRGKRGGLLEGPGMGMEGMGPGPMMAMQPGGTPGARALPPEAIVGYHAGGDTIPKEARAVVVMAAVPLEKQFEEYEKAFKEALDFDPVRDVPRYVLYVVERADVTADPAQDPAAAQWAALSIGRALGEMNLWGPSPREVVEVTAIDPILTNRVPPFMQREIYEALLHPDIPIAQTQTAEQLAAAGQMVRPGDAAAAGPAIKEEDLTNPNAAPVVGANAGGPGGEGMRMMQQPGGYPAMRPSGPGFGEGMMGMAGSPGSQMAIAKYRLLRFTDTTIQPNKKYRYRVKLILEDPNNPFDGPAPRWDPTRSAPLRKPSIQSMSNAALTRVRNADATKAKDPNARPFLLYTDASEPSDIVELPPVNRYFAGKATAGNGNPLAMGTPPNVTFTPPVMSTQPSTNLLTVGFDPAMAVDVPAEKEVFRGSTLNFEKEVEVIHPSLLSIIPIGKYTFRNNSIVIDFVGGSDIPNVDTRRSDKVQEPSEVLIFDGEGNLQLLDETDDIEGFRRYLPPKVEEPKTPVVPGAEQQFPGGILEGGGPGPRRPPPRRGG
jgi:hypothetical protein